MRTELEDQVKQVDQQEDDASAPADAEDLVVCCFYITERGMKCGRKQEAGDAQGE